MWGRQRPGNFGDCKAIGEKGKHEILNQVLTRSMVEREGCSVQPGLMSANSGVQIAGVFKASQQMALLAKWYIMGRVG